MSREIKFRTPIFYKGKFRKFIYWGIDVPEKGVDSYRPNEGNDYKRKDDEQYSGRKDRNGVEIYEGDILRRKYGETSNTGRVEFSNGSFGVTVKYSILWFALRELRHMENIEVIGNIH